MLYGYIEKNKHNGTLTVKIDGYNKHTFYGYSRKSAITHYKNMNDLKYKRIIWLTI